MAVNRSSLSVHARLIFYYLCLKGEITKMGIISCNVSLIKANFKNNIPADLLIPVIHF